MNAGPADGATEGLRDQLSMKPRASPLPRTQPFAITQAVDNLRALEEHGNFRIKVNAKAS